LKFRFATWLICALLFVAAVDTIPDPPAINPPGRHGCEVSAVHVRGAFTLLEKEWFVAPVSSRGERSNWLSFKLSFDTKPAAVFPLPLVHHAADTSPPSFS
jgi:hypothetical protein